MNNAADARKNHLVSEPSHHATRYFSKNEVATEMKKKKNTGIHE